MPTVSDIFKALRGPTDQGPATVGRIIGKPTEHAVQLRRRGRIPVVYWPALVEYAEKKGIKGVTYADLVAAHAHDVEQMPKAG